MLSLVTNMRRVKKSVDPLYEDWQRHTKEMKSKRMFDCVYETYEEYLRYRYGRIKKYVPAKNKTLQVSSSFRRTSTADTVISVLTSVNTTGRKKPLVYTGDYVVGIATMHKSNMVPVGREDSPEDYAKMRRN